MHQFHRNVVWPSSSHLCIRILEYLLKFSDISSNVNLWTTLGLEENCYKRTQSLNAALFVHTGEFVTNVLGMNVAYVNTKPATSKVGKLATNTVPGVILLPSQKTFLIIFRRLFNVRYIGDISTIRYFIVFEMHIHLPLALRPVLCTNKLSIFYFMCGICRLATDN
jgi:hypothetical protein